MLGDSDNEPIPDGVASLGSRAEIFLPNVLASGVVPQVSVIMGPCVGAAATRPR